MAKQAIAVDMSFMVRQHASVLSTNDSARNLPTKELAIMKALGNAEAGARHVLPATVALCNTLRDLP